MHLDCNTDSSYFNRTKFMNDFSLITGTPSSHFNKAQYEKNNADYYLDAWKKQSDSDPSKIKFVRNTFRTDSESSSENDDSWVEWVNEYEIDKSEAQNLEGYESGEEEDFSW